MAIEFNVRDVRVSKGPSAVYADPKRRDPAPNIWDPLQLRLYRLTYNDQFWCVNPCREQPRSATEEAGPKTTRATLPNFRTPTGLRQYRAIKRNQIQRVLGRRCLATQWGPNFFGTLMRLRGMTQCNQILHGDKTERNFFTGSITLGFMGRHLKRPKICDTKRSACGS